MVADTDIQHLMTMSCEYANAYRIVHGHLPLVMHSECYEFFGEPVSIEEAHVFDGVENAEVVIESSATNRKLVNFSELKWQYHFA